MESREERKRGTVNALLPSYAAHGVAVVAIVVVLGVQVPIHIEVEVVRVVLIVDYRRPVVAVAAYIPGLAFPVPAISKVAKTVIKKNILSSAYPLRYATAQHET
ncbi:hypothetical protein IKF12_00180 [Candidatus Saccharibacteria bacterium]|nr:hypothetical protein [Candidatus Saccharibacteria bacterium]